MSHRNQSKAFQTIHLSLSFFRSTGGLSQDTGPRIFTHQQVNDRSPILPMRVPSLLSLNPCGTNSPRKRKKRTESPFHISSFILIPEYMCDNCKRSSKRQRAEWRQHYEKGRRGEKAKREREIEKRRSKGRRERKREAGHRGQINTHGQPRSNA